MRARVILKLSFMVYIMVVYTKHKNKDNVRILEWRVKGKTRAKVILKLSFRVQLGVLL